MSKKWKERIIRLPDDHAWTSRPGCKVFVLERGKVRFDFPEDWVTKPVSDSIEFYDRQPPDDDCRLAVSCINLPPIDWSGLPLSRLLEEGEKADTRPISTRGEIQQERRADLEIAWREVRFPNPSDGREACSLICMARRRRIQALITFDFWLADRERSLRIWTTVLKSLQVDVRYDHPTSGRVIQ
ncbi:MAG TPA: hypothetical protein VGM03_10740 [Phycisphaerae bacterium]|jgi:hypothetical protein